jgi:hypothetical protein
MPAKDVLVVALDVPYPDDYGGARDMWQRLRLLHQHGYALSLIATYKDEHRRATFEASPESRIFKEISLFRSSPWRGLASVYPYAVGSRRLTAAQVEQAAARLGPATFDAVEIEGLQAVGNFLTLRARLRYRKALVRPFNRESATGALGPREAGLRPGCTDARFLGVGSRPGPDSPWVPPAGEETTASSLRTGLDRWGKVLRNA